MVEKPLYGSLYVSAQEIKYMIIIDRILFDEKERRLFHGNHSGNFYNRCLFSFSFPFYCQEKGGSGKWLKNISSSVLSIIFFVF